MAAERTIDDVINTVGDQPNLAMLALVTWATCTASVGSVCAYMLRFTGFIPWEPITCLTKNCTASFVTPKDFLNVTKVCDEGMEYGVDYTWNISRTTLAAEWDLICDYNKVSFLESLYFIGGMISLCIGSYLYDTLGRRKACLIGALVCTVGTLLGVFCHSYNFMVLIRLLMGFGNFLNYTGGYIWVMEFMPEKLRNYYNTYSMLIWTMGYPILVGIGYTIKTWHYIHLAAGVFCILCYISFTFFPDSPRYLLSVGREEDAKAVLETYAKVTNTPLSLTGVKLIGSANKNENTDVSFLSRMKEYRNHPGMALELAILSYLWFTCCLLYYGLNYGWGSFGATPYVNYLFAGASEVVAYILMFLFIKFLGRKKTLSCNLFASAACFLLSLVPWVWTETWSLDRVMALMGVIWISISFSMLFLYVGELAPTCLRGFTISFCSVVARIAAVFGPFLGNTSGSTKLLCTAAMAAVGSGLVYFLPETKDMPIPAEAADVSDRRLKQKLPLCKPACRDLVYDNPTAENGGVDKKLPLV